MAKVTDTRNSVIGVDIGSVSLSAVQLSPDGKILNRFYKFHKGNLHLTFSEALKSFDLTTDVAFACTASSTCLNKKFVRSYNNQVAIMAAARFMYKEAASVLHVGAEKFMLIKFDEKGKYQSAKTNSSCAAGTGSFLDQQSGRLNLSGIEELCEKALGNSDAVPFIASRCAVFANTDIIHAQQRGFSVSAICNSLCNGLAENINNTVFKNEQPPLPILMSGGVSKNMIVRDYLEKQLKTRFLDNEDGHLLGAIGAGLLLLEEGIEVLVSHDSINDLLVQPDSEKQYFHEPLATLKGSYPDFSGNGSSRFKPRVSAHPSDVEIDIYSEPVPYTSSVVYAGIDIGSTSTKAILIDEALKPVAGFYTYTAGAPLSAVKAILETIEYIANINNSEFIIKGIGTTGSGRKFIGKILNADLIVDEITSHARAAYELNPLTDTIIEIGGQDAKFTLMRNGNVTFSQMNSVCAAGTGSFLQEQAKKLGCSLSDYASKAENCSAPLASDRCAVFMERDISQFLNNGYSVNEILATALHSVTANYLQKVASEGMIGQHICFQGATAKNKSLVAAFEQRLKKPVYVSKYCHLTGALGTALMLAEEKVADTKFRGIQFFREEIQVETETCTLCTNRCCISLAEVSGEKVAYGFMCGRDYDTKHFVSKNTSGFDLLKSREKVFPVPSNPKHKSEISIGIPATLHLFGELPLWRRFFNNLSIKTFTSESYHDSLKTGRCLAGAEFCSPINSIFGHVVYLAEKADYIFLPVLLHSNDSPDEDKDLYCYYTQFSTSLIYTLKINGIPDKCISPLLNFQKGKFHVAAKLHQSLKSILKNKISYLSVYNAFNEALQWHTDRKDLLHKIFSEEFNPGREIAVVLLGRPYIVLTKSLNKGIPEIFNSLGIKSFYQDMLPDNTDHEDFTVLLEKVPWHFASRILEASKIIAETKNLYPVFITAFKCSPDSFILEYYRKIFNACHKPYLILQIDEHDSNLGYETRIEAAIRSFKNHASTFNGNHKINPGQILPGLTKNISDKTLLFPMWDPVVSPLLVANLKRTGIDARLMNSSNLIIKKSMAHNTGQCLPVNIIAQEFIEYIEEHNLNPRNTILWGIESKGACNLRLFPQYIKTILENYGNGMEKTEVYGGLLTHLELSVGTCYYAYFAYLIGAFIKMAGYRMRPYELCKGETDRVIGESTKILEQAFLGLVQIEKAVIEVVRLFDTIQYDRNVIRPKVAIFGDFYVCDNDIMNQELCRTIEDAGGEIVTAPYNDLVKMSIDNVIRRAVYRGEYMNAAQLRLIISGLKLFEDKYYRYFEKFIGPMKAIVPKKLEKHLSHFNINPYNSGESYENILKIFYFTENYPDISFFVQVNPAYCCPSLVTEAMTGEIRNITGIPVVTITYDGTGDYKNDVIIPYLMRSMEKSH
jgi:predicted CoA-substrate-specific enzyme activase